MKEQVLTMTTSAFSASGMTAMPAWGRTHSDELIWDMVAFVRTLPKLSPAQYQASVDSAPKDHDAVSGNMLVLGEVRGGVVRFANHDDEMKAMIPQRKAH